MSLRLAGMKFKEKTLSKVCELKPIKMKKFVSWIVLAAIHVGSIAPLTVDGQVVGKALENKMKDVPPGIQFKLSEGQAGAETRVKATLPATDPLSDSQSSDLLNRLPTIKDDPDDQAEFKKRLGTLPAPKTGNRIPVK